MSKYENYRIEARDRLTSCVTDPALGPAKYTRPDASEIMQDQRRIIELCNTVESLHSEMDELRDKLDLSHGAVEQLEALQAQNKALVEKLESLLNWPNPDGKIKDAYIPGWLADDCEKVLTKDRESNKSLWQYTYDESREGLKHLDAEKEHRESSKGET